MSCDLLWEMDSQAWDWNSTETQDHHDWGYHLAKWVEEISRKWPWPRTWKWEWRWQQNQTTPHWQSCRSVSSYLPFARCSMELLLAATQKNGSCLLILLSFWVLHFHSHYITLRVLSFLVRGSAKRGEKKRRPVSVNDDVVLLLLKLQRYLKLCLHYYQGFVWELLIYIFRLVKRQTER